MNNYIDFSNYSDNEVLNMLKEKQKEYIILIQSELIAKKVMNYYGKNLYTSEYHSRINNEYHLLHERVMKKIVHPYDIPNISNINIPIYSIIYRLDKSREILLDHNHESYIDDDYNMTINMAIYKIKTIFKDTTIEYKDGILYAIKDDEYTIIDDNYLDNLLSGSKVLKK